MGRIDFVMTQALANPGKKCALVRPEGTYVIVFTPTGKAPKLNTCTCETCTKERQ